jgi:hypothetical protein
VTTNAWWSWCVFLYFVLYFLYNTPKNQYSLINSKIMAVKYGPDDNHDFKAILNKKCWTCVIVDFLKISYFDKSFRIFFLSIASKNLCVLFCFVGRLWMYLLFYGKSCWKLYQYYGFELTSSYSGSMCRQHDQNQSPQNRMHV